MAARAEKLRTVADLERAVRSLARHFQADAVYVIGSQAILVGWPDAPVRTRRSDEIDAYPANARDWTKRFGIEASEEINALFGFGSPFHMSFEFYVDGVDERTATLPPDWRSRAIERVVQDDDRSIKAVAPSLVDLAVSKLARLDEKDREFVAICHRERPFDLVQLRRLFRSTHPPAELAALVEAFLDDLSA